MLNVLFITADQWRGDCLSAPRRRGRRVSAFTENVDVMPTIPMPSARRCRTSATGSRWCPSSQATRPRSGAARRTSSSIFRDVLETPGSEALELAPDQCTLYALRGERYKYVHFTAMPALFFDLQDDPAEMVDRSRDPHSRDRVLEHAQRLLSWRMNHDERLLANVRLTPHGVVERRPRRT